jgi:hypothetical protein
VGKIKYIVKLAIIKENSITISQTSTTINYSLKIKIAPIKIKIAAILLFKRSLSLNIFPPITVAQKTDVLLIAKTNATDAKLIATICV